MESTSLVSLKKENQIIFAIGLSVLSVALTFASFNSLALTESLQQEFLLILVISFILLVTARIYFVHTVLINQVGLLYISQKGERIIPWSEIGSVEIAGSNKNVRYQRLLLRNKNGKLIRAFASQMLHLDIQQAYLLIQTHIH